MANQVVEFVRAARMAKTFIDWLESTGPASLLADIELDAAAAAFRNLDVTVDTRAQLWNAVNHLETDYRAALRVAKQEWKSWKNLRLVHKIKRRELANKCELILCLLTLCYQLLGEEELVRRVLEDFGVLDDIKYSDMLGSKEVIVIVFSVVTILPQLVDGALRKEVTYISYKDCDKIRDILKDGWEDPPIFVVPPNPQDI